MLRLVPVVLLAAGCHVTSQLEISRPGEHHRVEHRDRPTAKQRTIVLTATGRLRFVETLECPTEDLIDQQQTIETHRVPNLAAFVVGVAASAVGAIAFASAALGKDPGGSPILYGGGIGLAVGLPLAIGPWIGLTTELELGPPVEPIRRAGPNLACGERPIVAPSATVTINDTDVHGKIDADGVFSVSPYELIDAFDTAHLRPWNVSAALEAGDGATTVITTVIDGAALGDHARGWLTAATWLDQRVEPIRLVPGLVAGTLRVSITATKDGPAIRVVLPLTNAGPGEAWGVRGQIASPVRAIDGRMIYIGHLGKDEAVTREILIPVATDVGSMIRGATIMVSVELRDAHGTAPVTPVRFDGQVMVDLPR